MSEFTTHLEDVFASFGKIHTRRMFGGYGVYHDDLMFALVHEDTLYLKADDESSTKFDALGLPRFQYSTDRRTVEMSYYQAPGEIYDDPDAAKAWAHLAYQAALRSATPKKKHRKETPPRKPRG